MTTIRAYRTSLLGNNGIVVVVVVMVMVVITYIRFWGKVAETFAEDEMVLGYEIMNEPWCGDVYEVMMGIVI